MLMALEDNLPAFNGPRSQVRCFAHILNLVVKSILQLFEQPKGRRQGNREGSGDTGRTAVASFDAEGTNEGEDVYEDNTEVDNVEDWRDERAAMGVKESEELDTSVQPLRQMLSKVSATRNALFVPC